MELKELCQKTLEIFNVQSVDSLSDALMKTCLENDTTIYETFADLVEDLSVDWLQKIFQYYEADRKNKMQDYTPKSLATLLGRLTATENEDSVYDLCAGSGALTIQKWNQNHGLFFVCAEYDEKVIPYLLFNMAIRNMNGEVLQKDVLQGDLVKRFDVNSGEKFSTISERETAFEAQSASSCISNPPYNMKWNIPPFAEIWSQYADSGLPPKGNANYAFILTALDIAKDKAALILPNSVLTTEDSQEKNIRQYLVDSGFVEAIIACPERMFESTSIPTCVLLLNKHGDSNMIEFIDMRQTFETEIREQNGQFGGASHENRIYKKEVNIFSDEQIQMIVDSVRNNSSIKKVSQPATIEAVKNNDYILMPSRYIESPETAFQHRDYGEIFDDLNRIIHEKNSLKLTINESLARNLGLYDVFTLCKESQKNNEAINKSISFIAGKTLEREDFVQMSKNAGELKFENKSKDSVSTILISVLQMWKQHVMYLNNEENRYLAELRNALLPDLMNGNINV